MLSVLDFLRTQLGEVYRNASSRRRCNTLAALASSVGCIFYCYFNNGEVHSNCGQEHATIGDLTLHLEKTLAIGNDVTEMINKKMSFSVVCGKSSIVGSNIMGRNGKSVGFIITVMPHLHSDAMGLDKAPIFAWERNSQLDLIYCNEKYKNCFGDKQEMSQRNAAIAAKAISSGVVSTHLEVNISNRPCIMEVTEVPREDGSTLGYAVDITDAQDWHHKYLDQIKATYNFFEASYSAIAIYSAKKQLVFYNNAFVAMWSLDAPWLDGRPHYADILDKMRFARALPEQAHFPDFKEAQLSLFRSTLEIPYTDCWHLPDGRTIHLVVMQYAEGGLLFAYTDHTKQLEIERAYNTLVAVRRETLENINESVSVFAENGKLKLYNKNYATMWGLSHEYLDSEPSIRDVLSHMQDKCSKEMWEEMVRVSITQLNNRSQAKLRLELSNSGAIVDMYTTPLRDGCLLFTYSDITDSINLERSLREINKNIMENERSKSAFFENISYELRAPLTSIYGYASILNKYYADGMSAQQVIYMQYIIQESHKLMSLINDMLFAASIDSNKSKFLAVSFNLADVVRDVVADIRESPSNDGVTIEMNLADVLIEHPLIDLGHIKQVIAKIVSVSCMSEDCMLNISVSIDEEMPTVHLAHSSVKNPLYMQRQEVTMCIIKRLANTNISKLHVITKDNQYEGAKFTLMCAGFNKLLVN